MQLCFSTRIFPKIAIRLVQLAIRQMLALPIRAPMGLMVLAGRAASLGDDDSSIGDRNAPTASYAAFSPKFHINKEGLYVGGQFHDGREPDLEGQAGGPPLNPIEMGMPDKASVVERLMENEEYLNGFKLLYGDDIFEAPDRAYRAMTEAIAAFERTGFFSPF